MRVRFDIYKRPEQPSSAGGVVFIEQYEVRSVHPIEGNREACVVGIMTGQTYSVVGSIETVSDQLTPGLSVL